MVAAADASRLLAPGSSAGRRTLVRPAGAQLTPLLSPAPASRELRRLGDAATLRLESTALARRRVAAEKFRARAQRVEELAEELAETSFADSDEDDGGWVALTEAPAASPPEPPPSAVPQSTDDDETILARKSGELGESHAALESPSEALKHPQELPGAEESLIARLSAHRQGGSDEDSSFSSPSSRDQRAERDVQAATSPQEQKLWAEGELQRLASGAATGLHEQNSDGTALLKGRASQATSLVSGREVIWDEDHSEDRFPAFEDRAPNASALDADSGIDSIEDILASGDIQAAVAWLRRRRKAKADGGLGLQQCVLLVDAASCCHESRECVALLRAAADVGFKLPLQLLRSNQGSSEAGAEAATWQKAAAVLYDFETQERQTWGEDAGNGGGVMKKGGLAQRLVGALLDLLWRFGQRKTALKLLLLACSSRLGMYARLVGGSGPCGIFRFGAGAMTARGADAWQVDVRGLSRGGALVAVHWWLDALQDLVLSGAEAPAQVFIRTGNVAPSEASTALRRTLHFALWARGAPFYPALAPEEGLLAKGYSLARWIKDSNQSFSLVVEDEMVLPEANTMVAWEGTLASPEVQQLLQTLAESRVPLARPQVFSRLLRITDEKRNEWIKLQAQLTEGRGERAQKRWKAKKDNRRKRQLRRPKNRHSGGG